MNILILGSGPSAVDVADWDLTAFDAFIAINNAWRIRSDWTHLIHPEDLPEENRPTDLTPNQVIVQADDYVPVQNELGGFLYAGGTMAFTAGYWALGALRPKQIGFYGCDMVYPKTGSTHFYGTGAADPLRDDITLQSLEAKSARLMWLAAERGCSCVNFSTADESRLVFPRAHPGDDVAPIQIPDAAKHALSAEAKLGYMAVDGRYWLERDKYDPVKLSEIDDLWLATLG